MEGRHVPPERKPSYGKKSKLEMVLPMDPIYCGCISPLYCNGEAWLQIADVASPVTCLRCQPSSLRNKKVSCPKGPAISMATGVKMWH